MNDNVTRDVPVLFDYQLEAFLKRTDGDCLKKETRSSCLWRHRAQYAVSHTLNEFFAMEPLIRQEIPIAYLLEKWWPPGLEGFDSLQQYWELKQTFGDQLSRIAVDLQELPRPFLLYDEQHVYVPELRSNLSVLVQAAWLHTDGGKAEQLEIHKFLISYHEEVIRAAISLLNVFCWNAFGQMPEVIHIHSLLEGRQISTRSEECHLRASMDYVRLAAGSCLYMNQEGTAANGTDQSVIQQ
ncbi:hypothetical protein Q5741_00965 [Paenibacillus sp. JX-17]|uniref:Uncharacterized protein n=1 Tax=Paenibacillus lacisoli TaxID=3064525 RepID=A0ABT9C6U9_9BACL|nr:hypothetical protein [Paenibacillus sp. JX-17]MDO7904980.1 hypothetical protein [Paenibacillus sp. JX-17]